MKNYHIEAVSFQPYQDDTKICVIHISGHLTEAVNAAHEIFTQLFSGMARWRITNVNYVPAEDNGLASWATTTITAKEIK